MQVANPKRAQFQKKLHFIPSDFPHFLKSTIGKELAPSITALVPPFPILLELFSYPLDYKYPKSPSILQMLEAKLMYLNVLIKQPFRYYTGQYFAYLIVLDFESTCWKDKKMNYGPEISKLKTKILWLHCPDKAMSREPMRTNMPLSLIDRAVNQ